MRIFIFYSARPMYFLLVCVCVCVLIFGSKTTASWLNYVNFMRASWDDDVGQREAEATGADDRPGAPVRPLSRKYAAYNTLTLKTN